MDSHNRFFLVILQEMLKDDKISIPIKTVRKFGVKIPHKVFFKLPDGVEWKMEVIKSEDMIWFHKGWREFTEYYRMDHGSLLMLKFDGESAFKVFIYDKTANEIDYPSAQKTYKNIGNSIKLERDLRGKSSLPQQRPFKKVKPEDPWPGTAEFRDMHIVSDDEEDGDEPSAKEIIPISKRRKTISATKKTQALERTSSFESANPFFKVVMQPSYISSSFNLYVPCKFARKYMRLKQGDGTFTVANGGTWHASYMLEGPHDRARFVLGWREFVLDNHLKVGDVCVFELIKTRQLFFKVSIFPTNDYQDPSPSCQGGPKSWQIPRKHVTQNPFFEICIGTSSILQASLHIPGKFANKYLARNDIEKVTFKVGDRRWVVKVKRYSTSIKLSGGWRTFARDNALRVRDVCIFELVGDTYEFQVSILRFS